MKKNIRKAFICLCSFLIITGSHMLATTPEISYIKLGNTVFSPNANASSGSNQNKNGNLDAHAFTYLSNPPLHVTPGDTLDLTFAASAYSGFKFWRVWVDLNGDGDYIDANEILYDSGSVFSDTTTGVIIIPPESLHTYSSETKLLIGLSISSNPSPSNLDDELELEFRHDHFVVELDDEFTDNFAEQVEQWNSEHPCVEPNTNGEVEISMRVKVNIWSTIDPATLSNNPILQFAEDIKVKIRVYDYLTGVQMNPVSWRLPGTSSTEPADDPGLLINTVVPSSDEETKIYQGTTYYRYHNRSYLWTKDLIFPASAPNLYSVEFIVENYPTVKDYPHILPQDQGVKRFPLFVGDCSCSSFPSSIAFPTPDAFPPSSPFVKAENNIEAGTSVTIPSGQNYLFRAGSEIVLKDGFHAQAGSEFRAYISPCSSNGNPVDARVRETPSSPLADIRLDDLNLQVFPNPAQDYAIVRYHLPQASMKLSDFQMKLVGTHGQLMQLPIVQSRKIEQTMENKVDLHALPSGIYRLYVRTSNSIESITIVKN